MAKAPGAKPDIAVTAYRENYCHHPVMASLSSADVPGPHLGCVSLLVALLRDSIPAGVVGIIIGGTR